MKRKSALNLIINPANFLKNENGASASSSGNIDLLSLEFSTSCQVIFPLTNIITTNIFIKQDNYYYCNSFMQNTCVDSVTLHQRQTETKAKKTNWSTTKPEQPLKITNLNILSLNIHFFGHKNLNSFLFNLK